MTHKQTNCDCVACRVGPKKANSMITQKIRENGMVLILINGDVFRFAYSVGLTETFGLPEIIMVGHFEPELFDTIAHDYQKMIKQVNVAEYRAALETSTECTEMEGVMKGVNPNGTQRDMTVGYCKVKQSVVAGPDARFNMGHAVKRYGVKGFTARQIFIPDPAFRLPWHEGYDVAWEESARQAQLWTL
jgi:hypothetical protein